MRKVGEACNSPSVVSTSQICITVNRGPEIFVMFSRYAASIIITCLNSVHVVHTQVTSIIL